MTHYVFPPPAVASVPIVGRAERFAVHRIYCVGRNYAEHAKEMGFTGREPPFFFLKPADAVLAVPEGETGALPYPSLTSNLHHEVELVVALGACRTLGVDSENAPQRGQFLPDSPPHSGAMGQEDGKKWAAAAHSQPTTPKSDRLLGRGGTNIRAADALQHVFGYAVGLDMTRRDLQNDMKKQGRPWSIGKAFEHSAPIAPITPAAQVGELAQAAIWLQVNGAERQRSQIAQMIWNVAETIAHLSAAWTLQPGDLIYTGTPEGVGAVLRGDVIECGVDGLTPLRVQVV